MAKGKQLIDITGQKFHRLTCIGFSHMGERRRSYWKWRCDCGNEIIQRKDQVIYPHSRVKSCGCWKIEERSKRMSEYNKTEEKRESMRGDKHWTNQDGARRQAQCPECGRFYDGTECKNCRGLGYHG